MAEIDHIAVAVHGLTAATKLYGLLGLDPGEPEAIDSEGVRVVMLPVGAVNIELIEPTDSKSSVARFLDRRGEGLHHIALRVENLARTAAHLQEAGVRLVNNAIQTGAGGHRYMFIHPASADGVLIELVEAPPAAADEAREEPHGKDKSL